MERDQVIRGGGMETWFIYSAPGDMVKPVGGRGSS